MIFIDPEVRSLWSPTELNSNLSRHRSPNERAKKEILRRGLFLIISASKKWKQGHKQFLLIDISAFQH